MNLFQILHYMTNKTINYAFRTVWHDNSYIYLHRSLKTIVFDRSMLINSGFHLINTQYTEKEEELGLIHIIQSEMYFEKIYTDHSEIGWKPSVEDLLAEDWEIGN